MTYRPVDDTDGSVAPAQLRRGAWVASPFTRLARVHAFNSAGDAMIAVALAGSLFFSIDPDAARWRVLLYLVFTIAPFAFVGPFIGPAIDRAPGGRRAFVIFLLILRVLAAIAMIPYIDSLVLFPVAFANLVLGKSYAVAKASIVPNTVDSELELVDKNSRLAVLTGVAGFSGAAPAVLAQWLFGSSIPLGMAACAYAGAFIFARKLPKSPKSMRSHTTVHPDAVHELRSAGIRLSGSAMGVLRGIFGFMTFMIAFGFRGGTDDLDLSGMGAAVGAGVRNSLGFAVDTGTAPAWKLGLILACSGVGSLAGSVLAPRLRDRTHEENVLLGALGLIAAVGVLSTWTGGLQGAGALALAVGFAASSAKVAFDAIVQRDAKHTDYGASFARFETKFQMAWVVGALIPVILRIPPRLGYALVGLTAVFAAVSFLVGYRTLRHESDGAVSTSAPWTPRIAERQPKAKRPGGTAPKRASRRKPRPGRGRKGSKQERAVADTTPDGTRAPAASVPDHSAANPAENRQSSHWDDRGSAGAPVKPAQDPAPSPPGAAPMWDDYR